MIFIGSYISCSMNNISLACTESDTPVYDLFFGLISSFNRVLLSNTTDIFFDCSKRDRFWLHHVADVLQVFTQVITL